MLIRYCNLDDWSLACWSSAQTFPPYSYLSSTLPPRQHRRRYSLSLHIYLQFCTPPLPSIPISFFCFFVLGLIDSCFEFTLILLSIAKEKKICNNIYFVILLKLGLNKLIAYLKSEEKKTPNLTLNYAPSRTWTWDLVLVIWVVRFLVVLTIYESVSFKFEDFFFINKNMLMEPDVPAGALRVHDIMIWQWW